MEKQIARVIELVDLIKSKDLKIDDLLRYSKELIEIKRKILKL